VRRSGEPVGRLRRGLLLAVGVAAAASLTGCKVVPIATQQASETAAAFDAHAWADGLWSSKALPYFAANAKPLPEVVKAIAADLDSAGKTYGTRANGEGAPWSFVISGTGTVLAKNTTSRAGTLSVALDGSDPAHPVTLSIGPVIIGSAVRDSLPFVQFKDFTNQLQFADASKALTAMALAAITPSLAGISQGNKIKFTGALSMTGKSDPIRVTPVVLEAVP
jgi:predicted lipoprotein